MELLDKIPRWAYWTVGGAVILFFVLRPRRAQADDGGLEATYASMQLAAATNIDALQITASRDVALAGEYTTRYGIAQSIAAEREGQAFAYLADRMAGKNAITMQRVEHDTIREGLRLDYQLQNNNLRFLKRANDQNFKLAKAQQRFDYKLDKRFLPQFFEIELRNLARLEELDRQQFAIQNRRLDIFELQSFLGSGGIVEGGINAVGGLADVGFGIWDRLRAPTGGAPSGASSALTGAASGAALGTAVAPGIGTAVGAAAGGAGGLS